MTASVNSTKPRGASAATKAELDTISKAATVARVLLQLQTLRNELNAEQLAQACLVICLHLTALLQQRQGDLFVESTFPEAFDTFRALRAGPSGSLAVDCFPQRLAEYVGAGTEAKWQMSPNVSLALPAHTQVLLVVWVDRDVMKAVFEVDARHPVASLQKRVS